MTAAMRTMNKGKSKTGIRKSKSTCRVDMKSGGGKCLSAVSLGSGCVMVCGVGPGSAEKLTATLTALAEIRCKLQCIDFCERDRHSTATWRGSVAA